MTTKTKIILGVCAAAVVGYAGFIMWRKIKARKVSPALGTQPATEMDIANGRGFVPPSGAMDIARAALENTDQAATAIVQPSVVPAEVIPPA